LKGLYYDARSEKHQIITFLVANALRNQFLKLKYLVVKQPGLGH